MNLAAAIFKNSYVLCAIAAVITIIVLAFWIQWNVCLCCKSFNYISRCFVFIASPQNLFVKMYYFCIQMSLLYFSNVQLLKFLDRNIYNINFICSARPGECRNAWQIFYGSQTGLRKLPDDKISSNRNFPERNSIFPRAPSLWQCLPLIGTRIQEQATQVIIFRVDEYARY